MPTDLTIYDHYGFALVALIGTLAGAWALLWLSFRWRGSATFADFHGVVPPFLNVVGVLFALTLAFLANDTWVAHDRALAAVFEESDNLSGLIALAEPLPQPARQRVDGAVRGYARSVATEEWPLLAHRQSSRATAASLDALLELLAADPDMRQLAPAVHAQMLQQAMDLRKSRDQRIALSRTHVNPLKWLGMAFLGLVTLISIVIVHIEHRRAAIVATILFSLSAAPTAAIVLVQANPFQQPLAISPTPIAAIAAPGGG